MSNQIRLLVLGIALRAEASRSRPGARLARRRPRRQPGRELVGCRPGRTSWRRSSAWTRPTPRTHSTPTATRPIRPPIHTPSDNSCSNDPDGRPVCPPHSSRGRGHAGACIPSVPLDILSSAHLRYYSPQRNAKVLPNRFRPPHKPPGSPRLPHPRRLLAAGSLRRYREPALVEHLVEQCFEHRYGDPDKMLDHAELAVAVARQLASTSSCSQHFCHTSLHYSNSTRHHGKLDLPSKGMEQAKAAWACGYKRRQHCGARENETA